MSLNLSRDDFAPRISSNSHHVFRSRNFPPYTSRPSHFISDYKGEHSLLLNSFVCKTKLIFISVINSIFYFIYAFDRANDFTRCSFHLSLSLSLPSENVTIKCIQGKHVVRWHICEHLPLKWTKRASHGEDLNLTINFYSLVSSFIMFLIQALDEEISEDNFTLFFWLFKSRNP